MTKVSKSTGEIDWDQQGKKKKTPDTIGGVGKISTNTSSGIKTMYIPPGFYLRLEGRAVSMFTISIFPKAQRATQRYTCKLVMIIINKEINM